MPVARRSLIKAFAAGSAAALLGRPSWGQSAGPTQASEIDADKAKAEGKVVLYTSLDTQIVDAINAAFKQKYGIDVQYFRGGSSDVTSKVLAEADAGRPQADMVDASDLSALLLMLVRVQGDRRQGIAAGSPVELSIPVGDCVGMPSETD